MVLQDAGTLYPSLQATVMALNETFLAISTRSVYFIKTALVTLKEVDDINFERLNYQESSDTEASVLFQGEDPAFSKRPVSSCPQRILKYQEVSFYDRDKDCMHPSLQYLLRRTCRNGIGFESRLRLTLLLHSFYTELERYRCQVGCNIESVIHFEIYELVINEAVTTGLAVRSRGIKRSWKIEHSAASSWKRVDTEHITSCTELPRRFKGVRYRSERAKNPWIAEIKLPKAKKKTHIGCFGTSEEAARAYDVAAIYAGKDTPLNFKDSLEFLPPNGFENVIRKGQVYRDDVPTQHPMSVRNHTWTAHSSKPKETQLCIEKRITSQTNAPGAFIGGIEIGETATSHLPNPPGPVINSGISPTFRMSPLQEMSSAPQPTASEALGAAIMPLPKCQFSQVLVDTESDIDQGSFASEAELASEIPKVESDSGMLDLDYWTKLIELMDSSDQVQRSAPLVSDPLNFPYEVPSESLITQSDTNTIIPDFRQTVVVIPKSIDQQAAIGHTASLSDSNLLESSPATSFQREFLPDNLGRGRTYTYLEESNAKSEFSFITAFQALVNVGDSSRNMELLLQLVRQHYDKHEIEVVLRPKRNY